MVMVDESEGTNCDDVDFVTRVKRVEVIMKMKMTKMVMIGSSGSGDNDDNNNNNNKNNNNDDDGDSGVSVMMSVGKHDYLSQTNKVVDGESCIGSVDRDFLSLYLSFSLSFFLFLFLGPHFTFFPQ